MGGYREPMHVTTPLGEDYTFELLDLATVPQHAASVDDLLASLNAGGLAATVVRCEESEAIKPRRVSLGLVVLGDEGHTIIESAYLVRAVSKADFDGMTVRTEKIYDAEWTAGGEEVSFKTNGTGWREPKAVSLTPTGLLGARTGYEAEAVSQAPTTIEIADIADAVGVLRVIACGGETLAAGAAAIHARWG
ncbi:MAG: hypothetical protein WAZ94_13390 [Phycisphaerales bacterium]